MGFGPAYSSFHPTIIASSNNSILLCPGVSSTGPVAFLLTPTENSPLHTFLQRPLHLGLSALLSRPHSRLQLFLVNLHGFVATCYHCSVGPLPQPAAPDSCSVLIQRRRHRFLPRFSKREPNEQKPNMEARALQGSGMRTASMT